MNFQFDSLSAFFIMGGHGPYVWSCFALMLVILLYLTFAPTLKTRQFFKEQKRMQQRLAANRTVAESEAEAVTR